MKLFKLIVVALCAGLFNVGCTSTESPEQLIKKPIYNEQKVNLYNNVNIVLDKEATTTLPKNSSEVSTLNQVDLDNNKSKELVVFEKKEDLTEGNTKVGFAVLNDNQNIVDEYLVNGESIEYANFYDLDNDGYKEIILVTKKGDKSTLDICKFKDGKITRLNRFNPSWIKNKDEYTEMKVKVGNLDNDTKLDIIIANYNPQTHEAAVSLTYFDKYIRLKDFTTLSDVKNLESAYMDIKKITESKKGITISTKSFTGNDAYITQILYLNGNKLLKAFDEKDIKTKNPYYMAVEDIDNNGIVEIPIINNNTRGYNKKSSANVSWYNWNGKEKEESKLVFTSQVYYNYTNNFKLNIPNILANKIYIGEEFKDNKSYFEFFYYDVHQKEPVKLFTISKVVKNKIDDRNHTNVTTNSNNSEYTILENENESFVLIIDNPKILKELNISKEAIKENFSAIY
jgi:hypothetical protein